MTPSEVRDLRRLAVLRAFALPLLGWYVVWFALWLAGRCSFASGPVGATYLSGAIAVGQVIAWGARRGSWGLIALGVACGALWVWLSQSWFDQWMH